MIDEGQIVMSRADNAFDFKGECEKLLGGHFKFLSANDEAVFQEKFAK